MNKELQKILEQKKKSQEAYSKYSDNGRIGMVEPPPYTHLEDGPSCDIKLKPPKFPKNTKTSKKVYKDTYFIRPMGHFNHVYDLKERLYIVSILKEHDVLSWIDINQEKIEERINEYRYTKPDIWFQRLR